jgi:hypothetical protein
VHGGRGEALIERGKMKMEGGMDKGKKEENLDPIMMDNDQIKRIIETGGNMHSGVPYQYKVNTKKRIVVAREGLARDEEEANDLWAMEKIEEILHATYERKTRGPRVGREGRNPIHINVNVEPIKPCATNTPKRTPSFRQPNLRRKHTTGVHLHKAQQLEELVHVALVKYLHHTEVVVRHSVWKGTIPPSGYHNSKEKRRKTWKKNCLSVRRFGKRNRS